MDDIPCITCYVMIMCLFSEVRYLFEVLRRKRQGGRGVILLFVWPVLPLVNFSMDENHCPVIMA